jgi:Domain of unknown function (DUF4124)
MRTIFAAITIAAAVVSAPVFAEQNQSHNAYRYRWTDAQGQPHYSDSLSAEAMKYGYDVVNDRGLTVSHVNRQLNPEERAAAQKAAEAQAATKRAADEQARTDAQMLNAYPTEAAYQASLKQNVDSIDQQINTTRINLRSQEKALTDLLARAGEAERAKQPVPKSLNDSIAQQRNVVASQRDALLRQQTARDTAEQKIATQVQHYREQKAAAAKDSAE